MPRRPWVVMLITLIGLGFLPAAASAQVRAPAPPPGAPAEAWILVDADTGKVIDGFDQHRALPPASTTKLMTALVATERLASGQMFTVGETPAAQPAMRIGMQAGQSWALEPALHSLLMVSANDAAYALAEASSGSLTQFAADMNATAKRYGMVDSTFNDPAGFDDSASFNGGSRVSAYDLAIAARNALAVPELAAIAALTEYRFTGPERDHRLFNHNKLLRRYPGAVGLKTGYTRLAGHTFVGAATRGGRTMIVVLLNTGDTYGASASLLDRGFATPVSAEGNGERIPEPQVQPYRPAPLPPMVGENAEAAATVTEGSAGTSAARRLTFLAAGLAGAFVVLRRRAVQRRRLRTERRRRLAEERRQEMLRLNQLEAWNDKGPFASAGINPDVFGPCEPALPYDDEAEQAPAGAPSNQSELF